MLSLASEFDLISHAPYYFMSDILKTPFCGGVSTLLEFFRLGLSWSYDPHYPGSKLCGRWVWSILMCSSASSLAPDCLKKKVVRQFAASWLYPGSFPIIVQYNLDSLSRVLDLVSSSVILWNYFVSSRVPTYQPTVRVSLFLRFSSKIMYSWES